MERHAPQGHSTSTIPTRINRATTPSSREKNEVNIPGVGGAKEMLGEGGAGSGWEVDACNRTGIRGRVMEREGGG